MDCFDVLKKRGYNLDNYSPDTYVRLVENNITDKEDCEPFFWLLEAIYG